MSADNWTICPRCKAMHLAMHQRLHEELAADYGKIPASEYVARLTVLQTPFKLNNTLAEYRDYGVDESGLAGASMHASCSECSYEVSVEVRQQTDLKIPPMDDTRAWSDWRERILNPEKEKNRR